MGGKDKIKTELVHCGNADRHAVSFREEEMACSEQESVEALGQKNHLQTVMANKITKKNYSPPPPQGLCKVNAKVETK